LDGHHLGGLGLEYLPADLHLVDAERTLYVPPLSLLNFQFHSLDLVPVSHPEELNHPTVDWVLQDQTGDQVEEADVGGFIGGDIQLVKQHHGALQHLCHCLHLLHHHLQKFLNLIFDVLTGVFFLEEHSCLFDFDLFFEDEVLQAPAVLVQNLPDWMMIKLEMRVQSQEFLSEFIVRKIEVETYDVKVHGCLFLSIELLSFYLRSSTYGGPLLVVRHSH
jgi:hypothetical protein